MKTAFYLYRFELGHIIIRKLLQNMPGRKSKCAQTMQDGPFKPCGEEPQQSKNLISDISHNFMSIQRNQCGLKDGAFHVSLLAAFINSEYVHNYSKKI